MNGQGRCDAVRTRAFLMAREAADIVYVCARREESSLSLSLVLSVCVYGVV